MVITRIIELTKERLFNNNEPIYSKIDAKFMNPIQRRKL